MKTIKKFISFVILVTFIFPLLVDARAGSRPGGGGYRSGGGFGGGYQRSYQQGGSYQYRPRTSTQTPYNQRSSAAYQNRGTTGSFLSGLASGLLGAWFYNKIINKDASYTTDKGKQAVQPKESAPKETGSLLRIILILAVAFFLWRWIRRRRNSQGQDPNDYFSQNISQDQKKMKLGDFINLGRPGTQEAPLTVSQNDYEVFAQMLTHIQYAWAKNDQTQLQTLTTPDVFNNFVQLLNESKQQGITTHVSNVRVLHQDVQETWQEGDSAYVRVAITWSAIDYAVNNSVPSDSPNYLVDGNMNEPVTTTEVWTFVKRGYSHWLLADIQQI